MNNPTVDDLLRIIGEKEVSIYVLRSQLLQMQEALKKFEAQLTSSAPSKD